MNQESPEKGGVWRVQPAKHPLFRCINRHFRSNKMILVVYNISIQWMAIIVSRMAVPALHDPRLEYKHSHYCLLEAPH